MSLFDIVPLASDRVDAAFALVRMVAPDTNLARWRAFAKLRSGGMGGVLAVTAGDRSVHGLAAYRLDADVRHGRVLRTDLFVTVELNNRAPARAALLAALEARAEREGCDAVCLTMPARASADPAKQHGWSAVGLHLDTVSLVKQLGQAERQTSAAG